jgi:glycosyltransferase involved in cell wall biosynthesis
MNPEIAVLLPVYNPSDDLEATLDSLRKQTLPFRLFLVDDGSKMNVAYEKLTAGMDTKIMRLPKNLGITGAMNAGLEEILKGHFAYIARIDSGDICKPERFSKQIGFLIENPNIDVLGSFVEMRQFDENNNLKSTRIWQVPLSPEGCRNYMYYNLPVSHPALMLRRRVYEKLNGYSEAYPAAEDFDLIWRATKAGFNITNLQDILVVKDENPNSISQKRRRRQIYSRLRIQWANRNLLKPASVIGLVRSALTFAAPASAIHFVRKILVR